MIPPVEVRQNLACADPRCTCVFYRWDQEIGHWCVLDVTKYHKTKFGIQWRWGNPIKPCSKHITAEETVILADQYLKEVLAMARFRDMMELCDTSNLSC